MRTFSEFMILREGMPFGELPSEITIPADPQVSNQWTQRTTIPSQRWYGPEGQETKQAKGRNVLPPGEYIVKPLPNKLNLWLISKRDSQEKFWLTTTDWTKIQDLLQRVNAKPEPPKPTFWQRLSGRQPTAPAA